MMNTVKHLSNGFKLPIKAIVMAVATAGISVGTQAQELSLGTSLTITQTSGGFNASPSITASSGNVSDVVNVPLVTNGIPNFAFTFTGSGVASQSFVFTPGVVI